jgi:hypothetical protein
MSTRGTLWHNDEFHLYQEGFDNENVYLEIEGDPRLESLVIKIPLLAWKEMRRHTLEPEEGYSDMSADEFATEAARAVDEHRLRLERESKSQFGRMAGMALFGSPDSSRDEMIRCFLRFYRPAAMPVEAEEAAP